MTRRTSLCLPPKITIDEWRRIGDQILIIAESSTWWLGDWLIYGQSQYPDRYMRAIEQTSLDYQTLRNYAWVARRYPVRRRRQGVSFQHHAELTSLPDNEQDEWLERVQKFNWSRNELRTRLRSHRRADSAAVDKESCEVLNIKVSVPLERQQRWTEAASSAELDLATWMISILDDAAGGVVAGLAGTQSAIGESRAA